MDTPLNTYEKIYALVADIPYGKVATYGQLAWMAGRPGAARMAGYAMSRIPAELDIPSHRVVNSQGRMAPEHAFGGAQFQRLLLEQEGVIFRENGCVDLKKCLWKLYD